MILHPKMSGMLVENMKERRVDDLSHPPQIMVYNLRDEEWKYLPQVGIYTLGFPCTPWSMTLASIVQHSIWFPTLAKWLRWSARLPEERTWQRLEGSKLSPIFRGHRDHQEGQTISLRLRMCFLTHSWKR